MATSLLSTASTFIVNLILLNKPKPDLLKDFVAARTTAVLPTVLVVGRTTANNLQDLVRMAKTSHVTYACRHRRRLRFHLAGARCWRTAPVRR